MQVKTAYRMMLTGYFGLIPLIIGWYGFAVDDMPTAGRQFIVVALLVPLLFPLLGLVRAKRYTIAWSSMMSVFYFGWGITETWLHSGAIWPWIGIALGWMWFWGAVSYCRKVKTGEPYPT